MPKTALEACEKAKLILLLVSSAGRGIWGYGGPEKTERCYYCKSKYSIRECFFRKRETILTVAEEQVIVK